MQLPMAEDMISPPLLRTEIFQKTLQLTLSVLKTQWRPLATIAACLAVPVHTLTLSSILFLHTRPLPSTPSCAAFLLLLSSFVAVVRELLLPMATLHATSCHFLGTTTSPGGAQRAAFARWTSVLSARHEVRKAVSLRLLPLLLLLCLFLALQLGVTFQPPVLSIGHLTTLRPTVTRCLISAAPALAAAVILLAVVALGFSVRYAFAEIIAVVEPQVTGESVLCRSEALAKPLSWQLLRTKFILSTASTILLILYGYFSYLLAMVLLRRQRRWLPLSFLGTLGTFAGYMLSQTLFAVLHVIYYFRARCLHDQVDNSTLFDLKSAVSIVCGPNKALNSTEFEYAALPSNDGEIGSAKGCSP